MTLDAYLKQHSITTVKFAAKLGISLNTVTKWRQQTRRPRGPAMIKIKRLTRGKVTPDDWYMEKRKMKKLWYVEIGEK